MFAQHFAIIVHLDTQGAVCALVVGGTVAEASAHFWRRAACRVPPGPHRERRERYEHAFGAASRLARWVGRMLSV